MFSNRLIENAGSVGAQQACVGRALFVDAVVPHAKTSDHAARRERIVERAGVSPVADDHIATARILDGSREVAFIVGSRHALHVARCGKRWLSFAILGLGDQDLRRGVRHVQNLH
jgi:hypothetical protein